jgi:hypothetical protein
MTILDELLVRIGVGDDTQEGLGQVERSMGGLSAPAAAAGGLAGGAFALALDSAMDITAAQTSLQNQLGLTEAEAQRAGGIAGDVFSAGFGGSMADASAAVGSVVSSIGDLGDFTDAELQSMSKSALGLADTFEFDVGESTQAVGNLIKSGLAKDGTEAFDLLTASAQKLPAKLREEIPALTNEYAGFFDQLGFTGPQMFGLLTQAAKDPTFELDKLGDAVKEFTLLLADTEAVKGPLKDLGLDVKEIQGLVNEGKGTQAFDQVIGALKGVEDQTKRTALQAALFGGPGEDLGNSLLTLDASGAAAASGLDKAGGSAKALTDGMEQSPGQAFDQIMRTVSTTLGELLAPALSAVAGFISENKGLMEFIVPVVLAVAAALGVWAAVQWVLNSALLASPTTWIILGIVALIAIIVLVATKTTFFQDAWKIMTKAAIAAWNWFWGLLKAGWNMLVNLFLNFTGPGLFIKHWDTIKKTVGAANDWVVGKVRGSINMVLSAIEWLSKLPGRVGTFFGQMGSAASKKVTELVAMVRGLPGRITGALGNLNNLLINAGANIIRGLIKGVTGMIGSLRERFNSITAMIPDWKGPMTLDMRLLTPSGEAVMGGFMAGVDNQAPALRKQLGSLTAGLPAMAGSSAPSLGKMQAGGPMTITIRMGEKKVADLIVDPLKNAVRTLGGGDVQGFLGGN